MQYNVAQLLKEATGATRSVIVDGGTAGPDGGAVTYQGRVEFLRTHQGLLARGLVAALVPLVCSRCLNEFEYPASLELEEEFFPLVDVNTGRRVEIPVDYEGTPIDTNHVLDLTEVLRQQSIAGQPIKPLCRVNCSGLCQDCGGDLNQEECQCSAAPVDPRWASLAALLNDSES